MRADLPLYAHLFGIKPWELELLTADELATFEAYANELKK